MALASVSERDLNFRIDAADGKRYLLKVANPAESESVIDFENAAMSHVTSVNPTLPIPRVVPAVDGGLTVAVCDDTGRTCMARLMTWLPGQLLRGVNSDTPLRRQLGQQLAELGLALQGFFHPAAARPLLWDMSRLGALGELVEFVPDENVRAICDRFIKRFAEYTLPDLRKQRAQVIYNDLNQSNVLVSERTPTRVTGIVDFGDMVHGALICDVAVAAAYQFGGPDPLAPALDFIAAYHDVRPLEPGELGLLPDLIMARFVTTTVITSWRARTYPENAPYILRNAEPALRNLLYLEAEDSAALKARVRQACEIGSTAHAFASTNTSEKGLMERREKVLGSAYRVFYERPLHIVRGEGVWLFDARGQAYLDAYNNVALVGHCHPRVVTALTAQAATLNTHTRYLHELVLEYAEKLLAEFPDDLTRVMFSCTGSEANELALRIATACTGHRGVIASSYAYHGNTTTIAQLSPSYASAEIAADWVELIPPPNTFRADSEEQARAHFLDAVDEAVVRLNDRGFKPAALLLDAGFTSDGMFMAPAGTIKAAAEIVRQAGGLYIADEVQTGFARLGSVMWGFERDNVTPDIVTLGKPIGNGHPLAATVTRSDLLDAFAEKTRYFNTFGGNPVSAAVGLRVLDVFSSEELAANSLNTGHYLHKGLGELASHFEVVADVRGSGLFAGVELVTDQESQTPNGALAAQVVNHLRENGVLISMIGPEANILKIRPPLPFQRKHVDQLLGALAACLSETGPAKMC